MKTKYPAVVVLSGGQDSITCLGLALANFIEVHAIGFSYGQRHRLELEQAAIVCAKHDVPFRIVEMPALGELVTSALVGEGSVSEPHAHKPGLPASFVPNRNAMFLTLSHAYAQELGARTLITGVCQTDYSGYPDCREVFVKMLQHTLNEGYQTDIDILTPLMYLNKAQTFALAERYSFLDEVINDSHTCYNGIRDVQPWGYGCGKCPACELRAKGYFEFTAGEFPPLPAI